MSVPAQSLAKAPVAKAPPPGARCFARGRPAIAKASPAPAHHFCTSLNAREVARAESELRKRFDTSLATPSKLVIDFGCDAAYPTIDEVVFEDGSGHGGTLRIVRFQRAGSSFAVRTISSSHYYQPSLTVGSGTIPASRLDALVARARVQMVARPHLIELSRDDGSGGILGGSFSSNDFHLRLALKDAEGRMTDRAFTGYESSESQEERLPMELASEPIIATINALPTIPGTIGDDDRQFFSARFISTMQGTRGATAWWVRERYIALASTLGTVDTIPVLVHEAVESVDVAGKERRRELIFDTVRAITGWDPRQAEDGTERTPDEAVRELAIECAG